MNYETILRYNVQTRVSLFITKQIRTNGNINLVIKEQLITYF